MSNRQHIVASVANYFKDFSAVFPTNLTSGKKFTIFYLQWDIYSFCNDRYKFVCHWNGNEVTVTWRRNDTNL